MGWLKKMSTPIQSAAKGLGINVPYADKAARVMSGIASSGLTEIPNLKGFRDGNKPKLQYWGGSQDALNADRAKSEAAMAKSDAARDDASFAITNQANTTSAKFEDQNNRLGDIDSSQGKLAGRSESGMNAALNDYASGRGATLNNAKALEASAANAERNYRQTSDAQFRMTQDANARQAMALGASGGASGLRAALATSSNANASAANQAAVIQAQELNQIQQAREGALVNAASIRSGVAGQDQNVAGLYSGRQQQANANQLTANAQRSQNIGTDGTLGVSAAGAVLGSATDVRAQDMDYSTNRETAQLNAARESEQQRLYQRSQKFNRWRDPAGINGGS